MAISGGRGERVHRRRYGIVSHNAGNGIRRHAFAVSAIAVAEQKGVLARVAGGTDRELPQEKRISPSSPPVVSPRNLSQSGQLGTSSGAQAVDFVRASPASELLQVPPVRADRRCRRRTQEERIDVPARRCDGKDRVGARELLDARREADL